MHALQRAAELAGGPDKLAVHLRQRRNFVVLWMHGVEPVPVEVFFKVVDYLVEHDLARRGGGQEGSATLE